MATPPSVTRTRESYVTEIMALMRANAWVRGKTGPALARTWGVTQSAVESYSAEASRRVMAEVRDKDAVTDHLGLAMSRMVDTGTDRFVSEKDTDAGRVAVAAGQAWAKLVGAEAPTKLEVSVVAQQYAALPPGMKAQRLRETAAKLLAAAEEQERLDRNGIIDVTSESAEGTGGTGPQLGEGRGPG